MYFMVCFHYFFEGFYFLFKNFQGSTPTDFATIEGTVMKLFLMSLGEFKVSELSLGHRSQKATFGCVEATWWTFNQPEAEKSGIKAFFEL